MYLKDIPSEQEINAAANRLKGFVHRTPVMSSSILNKLIGAELFFKCENLQKGGSFKIRGAMNAALLIEKEKLNKGIATHSSGNHAQAIAIAAKQLGIAAHIVMPDNSPKVKVEAVKGYGAKITFCEPNLKSREETLEHIQEKTGAHFIPPYNSYDVIAGQATMMKELIEDVDELEAMFVPIGGGGLISGSILSAQYFAKGTLIYGTEPQGADDAYRSFISGKIEPMEAPQTIADGLRTSLGELTFPIIQKGVKEIILVEEKEIIEAMKLIYQHLKMVIEPSAAVPLAALIKKKSLFSGKKIGLILCGGNVDLENLPFSN